MQHSRSTRRQYLEAAGGALGAVGLTALAGCTGGSSDQSLSVAYMPIYPDMQHFVMEREGYYESLDAEVDATEFSDGPSIVQAYATGDYDVALFGIVPAMIVADKTGFAKVTAANIQNAMKILARDEFAAMYEQQGADAFAAWAEETGEKFTFGTFPPGSVPDILLRYWLKEELGLDPERDVNIRSLGGAGPVRQALAAGQIDGTSIMEPVPTLANARDMGYASIAWAGDFMPGQPAAVAMMHDDLRTNRTSLAKSFIEQHIRATEFTAVNPDAAAAHASSVIGPDVLPENIARRAMASKASDFISNPHKIESGARTFAAYAHRLGKIRQKLTIDQLFDYSLYDGVSE
ncbi:ABC transporter substrate-binding protein [Salarchaeum sp. JOR-1]|uniref:ABC transporter substrate-binding protein n=1 Tax=Salarchaeum sp. JOR-1 TaxID=2599399 RepID=UPI00119884DE|nr:ABC transporter substrate-binding protein [Salarchaeum sp. JOR-1]QDX41470.1 ABC transporter substrate-binding protein [Salarchaeum sp. JOR-1]